MKNTILYILNVILLFIVGYSILPDFYLDKENFREEAGLLSYSCVEEYEFERPKKMIFNNFIRERVVIRISDRKHHEYLISDIYKDYWPELLNSRNYGKEIVLYLGKDNTNEDPFRIELGGEVLYDTNIRFERNALIIFFTFLLSIRNLNQIFTKSNKLIKI
ncbi:hypothetical protein [Winogradskyella sp. 3972H.M.0a.05]|uniref:hypothetical protein n=1 Tax=Winogradskyella sp. 3972H.M.0a.05 TaxID=2950277 RepID=UPI00339444CD